MVQFSQGHTDTIGFAPMSRHRLILIAWWKIRDDCCRFRLFPSTVVMVLLVIFLWDGTERCFYCCPDESLQRMFYHQLGTGWYWPHACPMALLLVIVSGGIAVHNHRLSTDMDCTVIQYQYNRLGMNSEGYPSSPLQILLTNPIGQIWYQLPPWFFITFTVVVQF